MPRISIQFPVSGERPSISPRRAVKKDFSFWFEGKPAQAKTSWHRFTHHHHHHHHHHHQRVTTSPTIRLDVHQGQISRGTDIPQPEEQQDASSLKISFHGPDNNITWAAEKTERILEHHHTTEPDHQIDLAAVLGEMQSEGVLPRFDVPGFLAFVQERLRFGRGGSVDYHEFCRGLGQAHPDTTDASATAAGVTKTTRWGFWISSPGRHPADGARRSDPYGGLM